MTTAVMVGDVLSVTDGIIVHGCNAQGVMASGIAKQIRSKYPDCYAAYKAAFDRVETDRTLLGECAQHINMLGTVIPWTTGDLMILNGITQQFYGRDTGTRYVSYQAIQEVFLAAAYHAARLNKEVHFPMIGAGLGGGDWAVISAIIDDVFDNYPHRGLKRTLWVQD